MYLDISWFRGEAGKSSPFLPNNMEHFSRKKRIALGPSGSGVYRWFGPWIFIHVFGTMTHVHRAKTIWTGEEFATLLGTNGPPGKGLDKHQR